MSAIHSIAALAGSEFDHLSRSASRVTRRIGGGRSQLLVGERWVDLPPTPPKPRRAARAVPEEPPPPPDTCGNGHTGQWYVEPFGTRRYCVACKREWRAAKRARQVADRIEQDAMRGLAEVMSSGHT